MPPLRWFLPGSGLIVLMALPLDAFPLDGGTAVTIVPDAGGVPPPDDAGDGAPTVHPSVEPAPVVQYVLRARLDAQRHEVTAEGTLRWTNTSTVAVQDLWFHLYLNGFARDDTLFMQTTGGEHRGNEHGHYGRIDLQRLETSAHENLLPGASNDPAVPGDPSQLHVMLPRAVAPGGTLDLAMAWTAVLPEVFARTGYHDRFHMVAQWFPTIAVLERDGRWAHFPFHGNTEFYADFGTYDVTMTIPRGWVLGATGVPETAVVHTTQGDQWRYTAAGVHDFAWTTWDAFRERDFSVGSVSVRVLFPPGETSAADRTVAVLSRGIPYDTRRYGTYPYPNLTVVLPPRDADGAGGMEYPTLITTDRGWWHPAGFRAVEYVTLHEYAHQYFYGLLASNENAWPFLDEGLAEYATCASMEALYGRGASAIDLPGFSLDCFTWEAWGSATIRFPEAVARSADSFATFDDYAVHVYSRTATVLRTAEGLYGRDRVRDALALYTSRWRFRHPVPDDFFQAFRDSGHDDVVDRLLIPALTVPVSLDYAVDIVESQKLPNGTYRGRAVIRRRGTLSLPVDIVLEAQDGTRTRTHWDGVGTVTEVRYHGGSPLRAARVDPEGRIALDEDSTNNARLAEDGPVIDGFTARVTWWIELVLGMVGP